MVKCYTYVIPRDYGFAPNPFGRECTLATCKPNIRKSASIDDWVMGTSSIADGAESKIVFLMRVTDKKTFDEYYAASEFQYKKAVMNGSLKKMYGDNIYHRIEGTDGEQVWTQDDSHHSLPDGTPNELNVNRDTNTSDKVLISNEFYYFGSSAVPIPKKLISKVCKKGPGHKCIKGQDAKNIIEHIKSLYDSGLNGDPIMFENEFQRYNGK
ncbi:hypothetical protein AB4170_21375 [Vibrio splendidus]